MTHTNAAARMSDSPVVALINGKGGVGKSTLALGLCAYTAQTHGAALLVDCDPQATAYELTEALETPGYEVVHEFDPGQLARLKSARGYDLIAVDCPGWLKVVVASVCASTRLSVIRMPPTRGAGCSRGAAVGRHTKSGCLRLAATDAGADLCGSATQAAPRRAASKRQSPARADIRLAGFPGCHRVQPALWVPR
jgi:hypothetical protein